RTSAEPVGGPQWGPADQRGKPPVSAAPLLGSGPGKLAPPFPAAQGSFRDFDAIVSVDRARPPSDWARDRGCPSYPVVQSVAHSRSVEVRIGHPSAQASNTRSPEGANSQRRRPARAAGQIGAG